LKRASMSATAATIQAACAVDESSLRQTATIHASLYFTLFGNARSATVPLSDEPANALDGLQCYTNTVKTEWDIYCRSAFRWPARLVYAKLGHTNANSFQHIISYSPFPATLGIEPVETRWASAYAAGPSPTHPVRDVTIIAEEPLAHLRRDFEGTRVQLKELGIPSVRYIRPPTIQ
jgi:hypothetical protein